MPFDPAKLAAAKGEGGGFDPAKLAAAKQPPTPPATESAPGFAPMVPFMTDQPAPGPIGGPFEMANFLQSKAGHAVGERIQDIFPEGSTTGAVAGTVADLGTQFATDMLIGGGVNLARRGLKAGVHLLPGAGEGLRQAGRETVTAMAARLKPEVPSEVLFERLKALNPKVKLPRLQAITEKLAKTESQLAEFGLESGTVSKVASKTGAAVQKVVPQVKPKFIGDEFEQTVRVVKENKEVPFQVVQDVRRRIGEKIGGLRESTDPQAVEQLGALKQMFRELSEDLDKAVDSGGSGAFKLLKQANTVAKREFASGELDDIFNATLGRAKEGTDILSDNFAQALRKVKDLRRSSDLFEQGFKAGELDKVEKTLDQLRQIRLPAPGKGIDVGSKNAVTNIFGMTGLGTAAGASVGGPVGAAVGGGIGSAVGAWGPRVIAAAVKSDSGRRALLNFAKSPGGLDFKKLAALATIVNNAGGTNVSELMRNPNKE